MLRDVLAASFRTLWRPNCRVAHTSTSTRTPGPCWVSRRSTAVVVTTAAVLLWYSSSNRIHTDAAHTELRLGATDSKRHNSSGVDEDGTLCPVVWGSNRSNLIDPRSGVETFQVPVNAQWLQNVALRDMALHEKHAACVDARGDVYQWGNGCFDSKSDANVVPKITLSGKDIIKVQLTDSRVYALSTSGRIYILAANEEQQNLPNPRTFSTTRWGLSGWAGQQEQPIDSVEIFPKEKLKWGETFISIAAGSNHLLALTSEGRTYAHPINRDANSHGQLGLRKIGISTPSGLTMSRELSPITTSENLDMIDGYHLEFSDSLFEIPSLRGVKVSQIAAGDRSSFVNTRSGKVLGWGANEHGQIGLGSGITLGAINIPTEIDLSRNIPVSASSKCLGVAAGGDLTCFVVERIANSLTYVDVLCCGNGQWGGLGNNTFSTFQGNPVRVKNISGLHQFDEREQKVLPIIPYAVSVSPTGHILLSLDTGPGGSGRDLVVWGLNHDYQLGTGKRGSLSAATMLERPEGGRFILARRKVVVKDLAGKIWKKNVGVEQCAVGGRGNSVVYWKIKL